MDYCGKSEETEKDVKAGQLRDTNNTPKEHAHGCCGGTGMWLHLIIMLIAFAAIWYFTKG